MTGKMLTVGLLLVTLMIASPAFCDDEKRIPAKPGDTIVADGEKGGHDEAKVTEDICGILEQEGTTKSRKSYQPWVKNLICIYLKADFRNKQERLHFVLQVLMALRQHPSGNGWGVKRSETVVHIVTKDPAYLNPATNTPTPITTAMARRSLKQPDKAAIGLYDTLFHTPPLTDTSKAWEVIVKAETAILVVFGLKKLADLTADHATGLAAPDVQQKVDQALSRFHGEMLPVAQKARVISAGIASRPRAALVAERAPGLEKANNLRTGFPDKTAPAVKITRMPRDQALGITVPVTGYKFLLGAVERPPTTLESIEEMALFKNTYVVWILVQTLIIIDVNVPAKSINKAGKLIRPRIVSANGRVDCTERIQQHELRHARDVWESWRAEMIDALHASFEAIRFPELSKKVVRRQPVQSDSTVFVEVAATYFFSQEPQAKQAAKQLKKQYGKTQLKAFVHRFKIASDRREQQFHAIEAGLDDNCRPVKAGGRQFNRISPVSEGTITAAPRLDPKNF